MNINFLSENMVKHVVEYSLNTIHNLIIPLNNWAAEY